MSATSSCRWFIDSVVGCGTFPTFLTGKSGSFHSTLRLKRLTTLAVNSATEASRSARISAVNFPVEARAAANTVWHSLSSILTAMLRVARLDHQRHRIADHGALVRHKVVDLFQVEAVLADVMVGDLLPAVVDRRRVPSFQLQQFHSAQLPPAVMFLVGHHIPVNQGYVTGNSFNIPGPARGEA